MWVFHFFFRELKCIQRTCCSYATLAVVYMLTAGQKLHLLIYSRFHLIAMTYFPSSVSIRYYGIFSIIYTYLFNSLYGFSIDYLPEKQTIFWFCAFFVINFILHVMGWWASDRNANSRQNTTEILPLVEKPWLLIFSFFSFTLSGAWCQSLKRMN